MASVCVVVCVCLCVCSGVISGNRVRCPWHGACFNVHTGDLEEYPGMDCLPCHKVQTRHKRYIFQEDILGHFNLLFSLLKVKIQNSKVYVSINKKVSSVTFLFLSY